MSELHLDGNAIGGLLHELFGAELTGANGECGACGYEGALGGTIVFLHGPGTVVRCPSCSAVLAVVVRRDETYCISLAGLAALGDG